MFEFEFFKVPLLDWQSDIKKLLETSDAEISFEESEETVSGIVKSSDRGYLSDYRNRLMRKGIEVSPVEELEDEVEVPSDDSELEKEFKSSSEALQYLSDITGKRVIVSAYVVDEEDEVENKFEMMLNKKNRLKGAEEAGNAIASVLAFYAHPNSKKGREFMQLLNKFRPLMSDISRAISKADF